jgi:hypothetical protein
MLLGCTSLLWIKLLSLIWQILQDKRSLNRLVVVAGRDPARAAEEEGRCLPCSAHGWTGEDWED